MKKIGRNDLCPCGSGKKYKNCCGKSNVITMESLIEKELMNVQVDLLKFALENYEEEVNEFIADWIEDLDIPEEALEMFYFFTLVWAITDFEIYGKTILEHFIDKKGSKWNRPRIRNILPTWSQAKPSVAIIEEQDENQLLTLEDIFTNEIKKVKVLEDHPVETGGIVVGILLPAGEIFIFFTSFIDLPAGLTEKVKKGVYQLFEKSDEGNPNEFLSTFYPEILHFFIFGPNPAAEDLEWLSPKHLEVAQEFQDYMEDIYDEVIIKLGVYLWHQYCLKKNPKVMKPSVYVATLRYLIDQFIPYGEWVTQNELAEEFGISSSSLSAKYRDMEKVLKEELDELEEKLANSADEMYDDFQHEGDDEFLVENFAEEEDSFINSRFSMERELLRLENETSNRDFETMDDIQTFLNQQVNQQGAKRILSNKEKAQELLYDAYESTGNKRIELAKKALKLYPNSPDAYNILAELELNPLKEEQLLLKAIEVGEKELGKDFIKENKGYFWGIVSTRPYMRAKFNYADFLHENERFEEAIRQYEDLLELNPNDNQGARYELFIVYVESGLFKKAEALLKKYNETTTANGAYNLVLIELLQNGVTNKAKQLLKKAKQQNPYVPDYLLGKKDIPMYLPSHYQLGSESEAIIYADNHWTLWAGNPKLLDFLKKGK
ncbi:tetratricopeptide repeat protein [Caldibacillus sp. 210928-DFI.2.22]|uniref:tetratricopeptide repeat protein n=1 Tax=unclassified Caldibacillus TaxID=2641266 RepID=UPI001D083D48|nr:MULTISPECIES: tetratricopeptide repeat protein [unclassified Caldibacillus]MCB7071608.1 tetratricopeptide repeat protein [Caldibacillus sp. 210928-DFI.2.22]MCB7075040.1 tetratricopeptide repeat protein [Caldibacillus sp. 210928-DFI.2.18]